MNKSLEVNAFGLTARFNEGKTTTVSENPCTPPAEWCAIQARKLFALTMMTSANGFEVFDELNDEQKSDLMWLMNDLSGEVAALAQLSADYASSVRKPS